MSTPIKNSYLCKDCDKEFTFRSLAEEEPTCPYCASSHVEIIKVVTYAKTNKIQEGGKATVLENGELLQKYYATLARKKWLKQLKPALPKKRNLTLLWLTPALALIAVGVTFALMPGPTTEVFHYSFPGSNTASSYSTVSTVTSLNITTVTVLPGYSNPSWTWDVLSQVPWLLLIGFLVLVVFFGSTVLGSRGDF